MAVYRKWYCSCSGKRRELEHPPAPINEDEASEPVCPRCGATPSSDPRKTISYRDIEDWDD